MNFLVLGLILSIYFLQCMALELPRLCSVHYKRRPNIKVRNKGGWAVHKWLYFFVEGGVLPSSVEIFNDWNDGAPSHLRVAPSWCMYGTKSVSMASSMSSAFSLGKMETQQNWVSNSTMNMTVWQLRFMMSKENLVPNVFACVVDSENKVGGRGFKDRQVWQLSTHSAIRAPAPGQ